MITVENVQKTVARHYGLTLEDMKSMGRQHRVSHPRQVAMWLCRELTTNSLPRLGRFFGYRDHTTILHHVHDVRNLMRKRSAGEPLSAHSLATIHGVTYKLIPYVGAEGRY